MTAAANHRLLDVGLPEEQTLASVRRLKRNSGLRFGVTYVSGFEPLPPLAQEVLYQRLQDAFLSDPGGRFAQLCDRHAIRWIVTGFALPPSHTLRVAGRDAGCTLYENLDARDVAYRLPDGAPLPWTRISPTHWRLTARGPGTAVLTQVWYPGWIAELDGDPAPVGLAEDLYLAVELPPGEHQLELRFDNAWVYLGQRAGLAAWLLWALAWLGMLRRRQESGDARPSGSAP